MLARFLGYFLRLGTFGFGGPIALAGHMQKDLVEERRWVAADDYREGLAFAQLAPGPLAAQLAMYLGWVRAGTSGATLVAIAFIAPSFLMVLALSALYVRYGGLPWMRGLFYGIGAAVIAIIARSARKLTRLTLGRDAFLWILFALSLAVTAWTESEIVWLFVACGVAAVMRQGIPGGNASTAASLPAGSAWSLSLPVGAAAAGSATLLTIVSYFAAAGLFVFGSGLAIVPFLHGGVVQRFHWLTEQQFLDAVAVSMITPGPVVITVAFIGYLVAGPLGAVAAAVGVFAPVYLIVVFVAPYFRRHAANRRIRAFVAGVTAAATGAIAGAVIVLGRRAIMDLPTALIALAALGLVVRKVPEPLVIAVAGLAGLALRGAAIGSGAM